MHGQPLGPLGLESIDTSDDALVWFGEIGVVRSRANPQAPVKYAIEVNARTIDRPEGPVLLASWSCLESFVLEADASRIAEEWVHLLELMSAATAAMPNATYTPGDFPLVALCQAELDLLLSIHPSIEDVLPLSPLQEGLLFHALYDKSLPDNYRLTTVVRLRGAIDEMRFSHAIERLVERHAGLRANFCSEGLRRPVQVIRSRPSEYQRSIDLSSLSESERNDQLEKLIAEARARRVDLARSTIPLFILVRLSKDDHRLIVGSHHISMDGWSLQVLLDDLVALYRDDQPLPEVPPYRAYFEWLAAQNRRAGLAAWQEALADIKEGTWLAPVCRASWSSPVEHVLLRLDETLTLKLGVTARALGLTLNSLVQGAWAILLGGLTNHEDVVFGVTVAGRPPEIAGMDRMVGSFINTLPQRVRLDPAEPLSSLLARIQNSQADLIAHQDIGLAEVQKLVPEGGQLFDSIVVFENFPVLRHAPIGERSSSQIDIGDIATFEGSHYALALLAFSGPELTISLDFQPQALSRTSVEAIGSRLERILRAAADDIERPVADIDATDAAESRRLVDTWNDTALRYPDMCLHQLFEQQALRNPRSAALVFGEQVVTYGELDERATALARYLVSIGVGSDDVVGLCIDRSPEMIVGLLAILKAGGVYLPLDPTYPKDRLAFMMADARASIVMTSGSLVQTALAGSSAGIVRLDEKLPESDAALPTVFPDQLAYVLYTSGSTGKPKGVMGHHRGAVARLQWDIPGLASGEEVYVQKTSLNFIDHIWEIFMPLSRGQYTVLVPEHELKDSDLFVRRLAENRITRLMLVPSLLKTLLDHEAFTTRTLPDLLYCETSGEALTAELAKQFAQRLPGAQLLNVYGTSEFWDASYYVIEPASEDRIPPIGRPIGNVRVYVLDDGCVLFLLG